MNVKLKTNRTHVQVPPGLQVTPQEMLDCYIEKVWRAKVWLKENTGHLRPPRKRGGE